MSTYNTLLKAFESEAKKLQDSVVTLAKARNHQKATRAHIEHEQIPGYYKIGVDGSKAFKASTALQTELDEICRKCSIALLKANERHFHRVCETEMEIQQQIQSNVASTLERCSLGLSLKERLVSFWNDSLKVATAAARKEHASSTQRRKAARERLNNSTRSDPPRTSQQNQQEQPPVKSKMSISDIHNELQSLKALVEGKTGGKKQNPARDGKQKPSNRPDNSRRGRQKGQYNPNRGRGGKGQN